MRQTQFLEIGCDGGSITIREINLNGLSFFQLVVDEGFFGFDPVKQTFLTVDEAWSELTSKYKCWYILYPLLVHECVIELLKESCAKIKEQENTSFEHWNRLFNADTFPF